MTSWHPQRPILILHWIVTAVLSATAVAALATALWYVSTDEDSPTTATQEPPPPHRVTVISWWGYLDNLSKLAELENHCQAEIQLTEYKMVEDFQSLAQADSYHIYIYPHYIYPILAAFEPGLPLDDLAQGYHPAIRQRYLQEPLARDTVFFQHAVSALIYDQQQVPYPRALRLDDMLQLAEQGQIVLQRDFGNLYLLLAQEDADQTRQYWDRLHHLVAANKIQLSNFASNFRDPNFVLGYLDSGEAHNPSLNWEQLVNADQQPKQLAMALHPDFSYVTSILSV